MGGNCFVYMVYVFAQTSKKVLFTNICIDQHLPCLPPCDSASLDLPLRVHKYTIVRMSMGHKVGLYAMSVIGCGYWGYTSLIARYVVIKATTVGG